MHNNSSPPHIYIYKYILLPEVSFRKALSGFSLYNFITKSPFVSKSKEG